jgi:2,3-bisphosphoglycerate-dependent phosphoglycerate mutase
VSDLQCPCRVVVARHAEAEYEPESVDGAASLTLGGRAQARMLGESMRNRRVAAIVTSSMAPSVQTAEIVAAQLAVPVGVRAGLDVGRADIETSADVVRRVRDELRDLVDLYRGETVMVVTHGAVMSLTLPCLVDNPPRDDSAEPVEPCALVEIDCDADGWRCLSWPGQAR